MTSASRQPPAASRQPPVTNRHVHFTLRPGCSVRALQRAPQNFPEKFVTFNGKLLRSMRRTVDKTAAFGQKMVMYWLPGGRAQQD